MREKNVVQRKLNMRKNWSALYEMRGQSWEVVIPVTGRKSGELVIIEWMRYKKYPLTLCQRKCGNVEWWKKAKRERRVKYTGQR